MTFNPSLALVSALFFVALVSVFYIGSWAVATAILRAGRERLSHVLVKRVLVAALTLPPVLAALPTLGGATLRHNHASALLEHHSVICRQMFARLFATTGLSTHAAYDVAGSLVNGLAWLLVAFGLFLLLRLARATRGLERGLTPYLSEPSAPLAAALRRVAARIPGLPIEKFYECPIPASYSSLLGFARPFCVLSRDFVAGASSDELDAIVAHEASHLRAGDVQVTFFVGALNCLFFFLRPVRLLARRWREEAELACDAAAVAATRRPLAMAAAILRASGVPVTPGRSLPATALAFADEAACSPGKRVEALIREARTASFAENSETKTYAFVSWLTTLLLAGFGVAMLLSAQALCYAHCTLEAVARLLP